MKRVFVLFMLVMAGMLVADAAAHDIDERTSLTIRDVPAGAVRLGTRVLVFGRLRARDEVCRRGKLITLYQRVAGADRRIATDRTDAEGEYRMVIRPRLRMVVYTRFAGSFFSSYQHSHACHSSNSRDVQITIRRR